jgi:ABC-type Fe3+ transport system substrate-binding protein
MDEGARKGIERRESSGAARKSAKRGGRTMLKSALAAMLGLWAATSAMAQTAPGGDVARLAAAAEKEGSLTLMWSEPVLGGADMAKTYVDGINAMFGTHLKVIFAPGVEIARLGNLLFSEYSAGQPASSDIYISTAVQAEPLVRKDLFLPVAWEKLAPDRIRPEDSEAGGRALRYATGLPGIPFNPNLVPHRPASLEEFLQPEWKGKFSTTPYAATYDVLAANDLWGAEKAVDYARQLSGQISGLMRCGEMERVASGEYPAFVLECSHGAPFVWQDRRAPIDYVIPRDAAQKRYQYLSIPKNAPHPAAATLLGLYLLSKQGQAALWKVKLDLDSFPESHLGEIVRQYEAKGVTFREINIDWIGRHPEIDAARSQMIKALSAPK